MGALAEQVGGRRHGARAGSFASGSHERDLFQAFFQDGAAFDVGGVHVHEP